MESQETKRGIRTRTTATLAGATVAACAACCISLPLLAPVLAWLGIGSLGALAAGWNAGMVAAIAAAIAAGIGTIYVFRQWRRSTRRNKSCDCNTQCST
jgi:membrane protein implicated in regulation of membrane protease activity